MPDSAGNSRSIEVHSDGMHAFAGQVDEDVEQDFKPRVQAVFSRFELGTPFGLATPSQVVHAARQKHHDCLDRSSQALASYANTSKTLVEGIKQVLANYGRADAASVATVATVQGALNAVIMADVAARRQARAAQESTEIARQHGAPIPPQVTGEYELRDPSSAPVPETTPLNGGV